MTIFGTRPEGIKMAPIIKELEKDTELEYVVVNTAQHREMLDQVLDLFQIVPDHDLNIMKKQQTSEELTATIVTKLSSILEKEKPDLVLVHGDTTTTFAGAYAAFLKKIPIGHIEAGLRTYDLYSPHPEEANRQLTGVLTKYHFAATERNRTNLLKENKNEEDIFVCGNTVIDALFEILKKDIPLPTELQQIVDRKEKIVLVTTHRKENLQVLKDVYTALNKLVEKHEDIHIVFPVHKNPVVREQVKEYLHENKRAHLVEPLDYKVFVHLMKHAHLIITDSGGIQEEAPALGIPVLVARNTTERQEGVEAGTLKLVGTQSETIFNEADLLLSSTEAYSKMSGSKNPYGEGNSASTILSIIKDLHTK